MSFHYVVNNYYPSSEVDLATALNNIELAYYAIRAEGGAPGRGLRDALDRMIAAAKRARDNC